MEAGCAMLAAPFERAAARYAEHVALQVFGGIVYDAPFRRPRVDAY